MPGRLILAGDVNLKNITDSTVPFRHLAAKLHAADVVFANLECCLHLPPQQSHTNEGFFADPQVGGEALRFAGIHAVGIANNVNYGSANIAASIARLDQLGVLHTGAGHNLAAARAPAIIARNGLRVGFVQRSSVYWPTDHEAHADAPGIAVIRGHTAYHVPMGRIAPGIPPANRPGVPPLIVTWADVGYLGRVAGPVDSAAPRADRSRCACRCQCRGDRPTIETMVVRLTLDPARNPWEPSHLMRPPWVGCAVESPLQIAKNLSASIPHPNAAQA